MRAAAAEFGDEEGEEDGGSVVGRAMASSLCVSLSALAAATSGGAGCEAALAERMAGASEAAGAELGGALRQAGFSVRLSAFERTSSSKKGKTAKQAAAYARSGRENAGLWLATLQYFYGPSPSPQPCPPTWLPPRRRARWTRSRWCSGSPPRPSTSAGSCGARNCSRAGGRS